MARKIDITDKLSFDENPFLSIKGKDYEVRSDAKTVLQVMSILSDQGSNTKAVVEVYEMLFQKKTRDAIDKLELQFSDFQILVMTAVDLIIGADEEDDEGEEETPATT